MEFENFIHDKMRGFGADTYEKFLCSEIIYHWEELFDETISAKITPVKIEFGVLFITVENSAFKDQLKFFKEEILDTINKTFEREEPLVKDIKFATAAQMQKKIPAKKTQAAQIKKSELRLEDIILTEEEIKACEEQVKNQPEFLRDSAFKMLLSNKREQKYRLAKGWHKCLKCDVLCAPKEIFCVTCEIKERELMQKELFKIFYDEPQIKAEAARKALLEKMPHMKDKCTLATVESARASLIQKIITKIRFGDEESDEVLRAVALEKRLPLNKLTPAIIRRALIDMQFDLVESPKIQRYLSRARRK